MIQIVQHGDKWRIKVEETFELDNDKEFSAVLDSILKMKKKHAQLFQSGGKLNDVKFQ